ncbi:MAG TPA: immunoglobulin domain-containing protein [Opitutaceae bacterium]|nr:immunoglobulin domain-containing protein [Opitutaceae bacterium]
MSRAKLLSVSLAVLVTSVVPAHAYDLKTYNGQVVSWDPPTIAMKVKLGTDSTLSDGTNFDTCVLNAMDVWNAQIGAVQFQGAIATVGLAADYNSVNEIAFGSQVYPGEDFDANVLAVTVSYLSTVPRSDGTYRRTQSDIIFNTKYTWDSYRGVLRAPEDLRRVAMHELGHVLGLGHPDLASPPQLVTALMNSQESNIDSITTDDINGAQALYGGPNTNAAPTITTQPVGGTIYAGLSFSFYVGARGAQPLSYQWRKDGVNLSSGTASVLTLTSAQVSDSGSYTVVVTNSLGSATSSAASLTVNATVLPTITGLPTSLNIPYGGAFTFSPSISGVPTPTLQWYKDGEAIPSATYSTYTRVGLTQADGGSYTLVAKNLAGTTTSVPVVVTVAAPIAPVVSQPPYSQTVPFGYSMSLMVSATGTSPFSYQWFFNGVAIAGATSPYYVVNTSNLASAGSYKVRVTNPGGSVESATADVTIMLPVPSTLSKYLYPTLVTPGANSFGLNANLIGTGSGTVAYQWFKDGVAIPGANYSSYIKTQITPSDFGNYTCQITDGIGFISTADMTVNLNGYSSTDWTPWLDSYRLGDVIYFLAASPGRIMRYDLAQEQWLPTVYLSDTLAPTAFFPTTSGVFVAYGKSLARRSPDLATEVSVATSSVAIKSLFGAGNLVYFFDGDSHTVSYNVATLAPGPVSTVGYPGQGLQLGNIRPSYSAGAGKFFTSAGGSPLDLISVTVGADGTMGFGVGSPYHGDYRVNTRGTVAPGDQLLFNSSGVIFRTSDLTYVGAVGLPFQDIAFMADGSPVVLRNQTLSIRSSTTFVEQGVVTLSAGAYAAYGRGSAVFVFGAPASSSTTPPVTKILQSSFAPASASSVGPAPGAPVSVENVFVDAGGIVNAVSRSARAILRWNPQTRSFLAPIPLRSSPKLSNYSASTNRLLLAYTDQSITQVNYSGGMTEQPVVSTAGVVFGLVAMDELTAFNMSQGAVSGDYSMVIDAQGAPRYQSSWGYHGTMNHWLSSQRRLYSFSSSDDDSMSYQQVPADGSLPSPSSSVANIVPPVRGNSAENLLLSGNGRVLDINLGQLGQLPNTVTDGAWLDNGLYSIRPAPGGTELQQWARTTYAPVGSLVLTGYPIRIVALSGTRLAVVTSDRGLLAFHLVDSDRTLVGSWNLSAPAGAPTITSQPASGLFIAGGSFRLSVNASGNLLSYQWRRNGTPLAGQNSSLLVLSGLTSADSGAKYDVVVSNAAGSVTSAAATLQLSTGKTPQTITFNGVADVTYGSKAPTVTATASSGLAPTFSIVSGPASISGGVLTITGAGTVVVRASQAGDATFDPAPDVDRSFTVYKASATVTLSNLSQVANGSPRPVSVTTNPPGLNTVVTYNGQVTAPSLAGTYSVSASVNDPLYQGYASGTLVIVGSGGGGGGGGGNSAPTIVTQPSSQAVTVGGTAVFSVGASGTPAPTYQWRRNGSPLAGQTGSTLTLSGVTLSDSGAVFDVVVSNTVGSVTSSGATLIVSPAALPGRVFFGTLGSGGRFALYVRSSGEATLVGYLPNGRGSFVVKFTVGADGSFSTSLPAGSGGGVTGLSVGGGLARGNATSLPLSGSISGGSLSGTISSTGESMSGTAEPASGPTAALAGLYEAPVINSANGTLYFVVGSSGAVMGASTDSGNTTAAQGTIGADGAFTLGLGGATVQGSINAGSGAVSGQVTANGSAPGSFGGVSATTTHTDRLVNISTRGLVGDGDKAMIAGFVISGSQSKSVLVRASGPTLTGYGLSGAMDDPVLKIYRGQDVILSNDNWSTSADASLIASTAARVGGFAQQSGSKDAALITSLTPGVYSAQVTRADGSATGVALVEVYDASVAPGAEVQKVINISTRGEVGTGEKIMIAGFVVSGNAPKRVLIRAVGPTLGGYGVTGTLADPLLKLYQGETVIASNDDWGTIGSAASDAAALVGAFPLNSGSKDAALLLTLAPGVYSAQVSGVGGTTGVALIEVYEVP